MARFFVYFSVVGFYNILCSKNKKGSKSYPSKAIFTCEPSQYGLFLEAPHLQNAVV